MAKFPLDSPPNSAASKTLTLAKTYQPYGPVLTTAGSGATSYGFTGEWTGGSNLQYLRARYKKQKNSLLTLRPTRPILCYRLNQFDFTRRDFGL